MGGLNKISFLPFQNIEIDSLRSKNEIENSIKINISWNTILGTAFVKNSIHNFEGFVNEEVFKIRRTLKFGRNSFIPILSGVILEKENGGSRVKIKLRLSKMVMFLLIVFNLFICIQFITSVYKPQRLQKEDFKEYLMKYDIDEELVESVVGNIEDTSYKQKTHWHFLFLIVVSYILVIVFFNIEARVVENKLRDILEG